MKWLLISKHKINKKRILQEYKRHPDKFDMIHEINSIDDINDYDLVIIGVDMRKHFWWGGKYKEIRKEMLALLWEGKRTGENFDYKYMEKCSNCKRQGTRLDISHSKFDGWWKKCRKESGLNVNAYIVKLDEEQKKNWLENEPTEVKIYNKKVPEKLGHEVREVIKKHFHEFKGIFVGFTGANSGKYLGGWAIALNPDLLQKSRRNMMHTIAHELTHAMVGMQGILRDRANGYEYLYNQQIPHGELQCEIWTFARHPDYVSNSYFSYKLPKEINEQFKGRWDDKEVNEKYNKLQEEHFMKNKNKIHELSKEAIRRRVDGDIKYLSWFKDQMKEIDIEG